MDERGWAALENVALCFSIAAVIMCISVYGCEPQKKDLGSPRIDVIEAKVDAIHRVVVGSKP